MRKRLRFICTNAYNLERCCSCTEVFEKVLSVISGIKFNYSKYSRWSFELLSDVRWVSIKSRVIISRQKQSIRIIIVEFKAIEYCMCHWKQ